MDRKSFNVTFLIIVTWVYIFSAHVDAATRRGESRRQGECPLCDSSVFSYCNDKLLHDACCCLDRYEHNLPPHCRLADCRFLHANTCEEHELITACCCNRVL